MIVRHVYLVTACLRSLAQRLGVDQAIFFTLLGRVTTIAAGLLTIYFIGRFLTPVMQGYYYTFNSLIALQVFVELGLTYAIVQFASHEVAHLNWQPEGTVEGSQLAKRRLQSLMQFSLIWFVAAAVLMTLVLLPLGIVFFRKTATGATVSASVFVAWSFLVLCAAINLILTAASAMLEGCGRVADIAILRLWQALLASVTACVVLASGGQLFALVAYSAVMGAVGIGWIWINYRNFFFDLFRHRSELPSMSWRSEIWPFQWRIALSWMSGYLSYQLINPLLFATHGPVAAGQVGMSLQIIGAMSGIAMPWVSTKAPLFGQLIAQCNRNQLDKLFFGSLIKSIIVLGTGLFLLLGTLWYLQMKGSPYSGRLVPIPMFWILSIICLTSHISSAGAIYLRAHKQEPLLILSLLSGIFSASLATLLIPSYGVSGAVGAYALSHFVVGFIGGTSIFVSKRKEWATDQRM